MIAPLTTDEASASYLDEATKNAFFVKIVVSELPAGPNGRFGAPCGAKSRPKMHFF
jgi:hypothetical protein